MMHRQQQDQKANVHYTAEFPLPEHSLPKNFTQFSRWINLRALSVLFLLFVAIMTWSRYYAINHDGFNYIGIARLLRSGDWHDTVNAYWGPLISWLFAIVSIPLPELLAVRLVIAVSSVVTVLASWLIVKYVLRDDGLRRVAVVTIMFMPVFIKTADLITPDLLLTILVLLAFYYGIRFLEKPEYKSAALAGLLWGLAYYAKSFGFVFAMIFFILIWLLAVLPFEWRRLITVSKPLTLGVTVFIIVSMPWLVALRYKYGHWMSGSAGKYNFLYKGPYPHLKLHKIQKDAPWLEPKTFSKDNFMAGYDDPCPPGDVIYTYSVLDIKPWLEVKVFFANLVSQLRCLWNMFGLACIPIIIGLVLCLPTLRADRTILLLALGCLFWILLYLTILPAKRYLMPIVPLLVVIACKGYEAACFKLAQDQPATGANNNKLRLLHALLLIQVVYLLFWGGNCLIHYVKHFYQETPKLVRLTRDLVHINGVTNLAQTYSCETTKTPGRYLAYIAGVPYAGYIVPKQHEDDLIDTLRIGRISHLVTLPSEIDESWLKGLNLVRTFAVKDKEYWLYKVSYDD